MTGERRACKHLGGKAFQAEDSKGKILRLETTSLTGVQPIKGEGQGMIRQTEVNNVESYN